MTEYKKYVIVFPSDYFDDNKVDEEYLEEFNVVEKKKIWKCFYFHKVNFLMKV
ncbi:hypothetical protein [Streptobacillus canis]|uniref:hypothetical protein n=1 Tax=Streptobacillus canis TaxID=2678686 RepID=UPI0012E2C11D|nr:hypothetical protein [Streptobacillus canis]